MPSSYSAFGAKRTAAASSDRSLLVTTTPRPYGVTRQVAEAATGQDHAHKPYCTGLRTSAQRTSDIDTVQPTALRVTHIYRRENGSWKIAHRPGNVAPADQSPPAQAAAAH
jgi:hypothetical protein